VCFGTGVDSFDQNEAQLRATFSDGSTGSFDLLVGEDGVRSRIRHLAFEDEVSFSRFLGYYTAAFVVNNLEMREDLSDAFYFLTVPGQKVAIFPIRGGRLATSLL
jgi:2-polyprenyl-6-methoxyphenol hydroxylase-like FAD-dependent oxidoreductase